MAQTYDVTGVSHKRDYVPLAAGVGDLHLAEAQAKNNSEFPAVWSAVLVRESRSGAIVATYVDGERQPH